MPTGYTARFEDHFDLKKWLKEDAIRAMGICHGLRENQDYTEAELKAELDSEHARLTIELDQAERAQDIFRKSPREVLVKEYLKLKRESEESNRKYLEKCETAKAKYVKALFDVAKMFSHLKADTPELIRNTLSFAHEQLLSTYNHDYVDFEKYPPKILTSSFETWYGDKILWHQRNVEYYKERFLKIDEPGSKKYQQYLDFIDAALKDA